MSKRTVHDIQADFNILGTELLKTELTIERLKEALTKANSDRNRSLQKLINLDNEFQKIQYAEIQLGEQKNEAPKDQVDAPASPAADAPTAG